MTNGAALIIPRLINEKSFIKDKFHYNKVNSHNRGKRHIMNLVPWRTCGHENGTFTRIQQSTRSMRNKKDSTRPVDNGNDVAAPRLFDVGTIVVNGV